MIVMEYRFEIPTSVRSVKRIIGGVTSVAALDIRKAIPILKQQALNFEKKWHPEVNWKNGFTFIIANIKTLNLKEDYAQKM